MTVAQVVASQGFGYEQFQVETPDNYQLTVMHIKGKAGAPVVFLQHGLFSSAETWLFNGDKSVAFQLSRAGFDVWLGNNRGSMYSRKNSKIDPNSNAKAFFDFSFYELGKYDAPTQINLVL